MRNVETLSEESTCRLYEVGRLKDEDDAEDEEEDAVNDDNHDDDEDDEDDDDADDEDFTIGDDDQEVGNDGKNYVAFPNVKYVVNTYIPPLIGPFIALVDS